LTAEFKIDSKLQGELKESILKLFAFTRKIVILGLAFFSKLSFQREIVILMYHSVEITKDFYAVDPAEFTRQIDYLKNNYSVVSLAEIVDFIKKRKKISRKSVAITFDDGSQDLYENAYPYLSKSNLPATVFVTTGYVGKNWHDDNTLPPLKMLTWKQIEEMSQNNIEFGAHTVTHPDLKAITLEEAKNEISHSKMDLEQHIKKRVRFFSYPFGRQNEEVIDIVKSSGFEGAVGRAGTIGNSAQMFVLNRIQVDSSVSFMLFKARLTKATNMLSLIEERAKVLVKYFWR
jgi:peptidoglycan/xylan/chitin deacetylase (PgdA/CDA1 family)